ncbi:MAG: hypothetical protein JRI73_12685 [Deltaproteobacteria bacterium]|nr:hypothetical protein [Deltaproteobacteria bacterium]
MDFLQSHQTLFMASILRIVKVLEKGFLLSSLLTMIVVMVGSLCGCARYRLKLKLINMKDQGMPTSARTTFRWH